MARLVISLPVTRPCRRRPFYNKRGSTAAAPKLLLQARYAIRIPAPTRTIEELMRLLLATDDAAGTEVPLAVSTVSMSAICCLGR